ncbi:hypothetical protein DY000_02046871 [Brassica cretica]|uniref:Uncharacterized protein n=1 Tax=Brassica cretica TaxID=69181 RepID=A0ABQ7EUK1_BRACR|nr:hypothetical protein DY000_02046871 [Brassica cretica]
MCMSLVLVTWRFKTNCGLPFSRQVIGAVVAQLFWLCMKVVLSFIAKDVVGKGLNHGTFVLTPKPCQVSRSFHVLRWPMGVENDLCFRETKPKSLDPEHVQSQFRGYFLLGYIQGK